MTDYDYSERNYRRSRMYIGVGLFAAIVVGGLVFFALQSSAMALAVSYVMHREQLTAPRRLAALGPLSLAIGLSRLILDRHWASDVLGGYCAGIALGATSAGLYELAR